MPADQSCPCPTCKGTGQVGPVHVNLGNGRGGWKDNVVCYRCGGSGIATTEMLDWMARGKKLREARLARGETLGDAAERLGMIASAISAMEEGKRDPSHLEQKVVAQ